MSTSNSSARDFQLILLLLSASQPVVCRCFYFSFLSFCEYSWLETLLGIWVHFEGFLFVYFIVKTFINKIEYFRSRMSMMGLFTAYILYKFRFTCNQMFSNHFPYCSTVKMKSLRKLGQFFEWTGQPDRPTDKKKMLQMPIQKKNET